VRSRSRPTARIEIDGAGFPRSSLPLPVWRPLALALALTAPAAWAQVPEAARAPAAEDAELQLETVTVNARRRAESAQSVPVSLSTLDGAELERQGVYQVQNLPLLLPGLNASYANGRQLSLAVRGIGNNPANEGLEGSVGLYLDNVYLGRPGMAVLDLVDLERVELLRGPQGTLFGKNTTAGVLNLSTRAPDFSPDNSVELSAGERGYYQGKAVISGPLSDTVAARIAVVGTHDDGWLKNDNDNRRLNSVTREGVRGQLLIRPDSDFSLRLIADYQHESGSQGTTMLYGVGPSPAGFRYLVDAAQLAGATGIRIDPDRYHVNIDGPQKMKVEQGGLSAEANWELGGGYRLTSITAWRSWEFGSHNDIDGTNADIFSDSEFRVKDSQVSQEIRLASPTGGAMDYVLGAYYFHQDISSSNWLTYGSGADVLALPVTAPLGANVLNGITSATHGKMSTDSFALFGQADWHLTERLDLTTGVRATYERKVARSRRDAPLNAAPLFVPLLQAGRDSQVGAWRSDDITVQDVSPSGLLGLSYELAPDVLAFANLSYGEKSGGVNINGVGAAPTLGEDSLKVDPERARSLEVGFKSLLWDKRLRLNASLFYARVQDYQATGMRAAPGSFVVYQVLTNVGEVESKGVEWEIEARPSRRLTLSFNGMYNDASYRSFDNAPCPAERNPNAPASCDLGGKQVQGAPLWTANVGGSYRWPWAEHVEQYVSANYAWRSEAPGSLDNSRYNRLPAYGVLNLATGWQYSRGSDVWELSLWARNALDKRYYYTGSNTVSAYTVSAAAPRTVGVTLRYNFM